MKSLFGKAVCIVAALCMLSLSSAGAVAGGEERAVITPEFPSSVKVGQYVSGKVTVSNLAPKERLYSAYYSLDAGGYWYTGPHALSGVGGEGDPEDYYLYADENGTVVIPDSGSADFTYKPGSLKGSARVFLEGEIKDQQWVIKVEDPVITHNAPYFVKKGTSIDFKTKITNTAYENAKISDRKENIPYYAPGVTVIDGGDIISQNGQDYSNTLSTDETLTFNETGTVTLKIAYRPMVYQQFAGTFGDKQTVENYLKDSGYEYEDCTADHALIHLDGVIEKTVTVIVKDEEVMPGDLDGGGITATDALIALQAAVDKNELSGESRLIADVDRSGSVTAADALLILQFAVGKIDSFDLDF